MNRFRRSRVARRHLRSNDRTTLVPRYRGYLICTGSESTFAGQIAAGGRKVRPNRVRHQPAAARKRLETSGIPARLAPGVGEPKCDSGSRHRLRLRRRDWRGHMAKRTARRSRSQARPSRPNQLGRGLGKLPGTPHVLGSGAATFSSQARMPTNLYRKWTSGAASGALLADWQDRRGPAGGRWAGARSIAAPGRRGTGRHSHRAARRRSHWSALPGNWRPRS